jgi:hypothetical protein
MESEHKFPVRPAHAVGKRTPGTGGQTARKPLGTVIWSTLFRTPRNIAVGPLNTTTSDQNPLLADAMRNLLRYNRKFFEQSGPQDGSEAAGSPREGPGMSQKDRSRELRRILAATCTLTQNETMEIRKWAF